MRLDGLLLGTSRWIDRIQSRGSTRARTTRLGRALFVTAPCLALVLLSACGEGTLCFGVCDGRPENITVSGNVKNSTCTDPINDPTGNVATVVFVYSDLTTSTPPFEAGDFGDVEAAIVSDAKDFSLSGIASGDLTVLFLCDGTGDRRIDCTNLDPSCEKDCCDEFAILKDSHGTLENVRGGRMVDIHDVEIEFMSTLTGGTANADSIEISTPTNN